MTISLFQTNVFALILLSALVTDLFWMRIPNLLNLFAIIAFVAFGFLNHLSLAEWGNHLLAFGVCFGILLIPFALGWMGGGDVKFVPSIALWLGFNDTLMMWVLYFSALGGLLTLAILLARSVPLPAFLMRVRWISHLHEKTTGVPYGIAMSIAGLSMIPTLNW